MSTPYSSFAVANYFIKKANDEGRRDMSPMKLQKLVYFSHALYLAMTEKPLIDELVQAWDYGPVVASLYHEIKKFGTEHIDELCKTYKTDAEGKICNYAEIVDENNEDANKAIEMVWNTFKKHTARQLSNITHLEGNPWDTAYNAPENKGVKGITIDNDLIKEYFRNIVRRKGDNQ